MHDGSTPSRLLLDPVYMHRTGKTLAWLDGGSTFAALSEVFMTGGIPPLIDKPCAAGEAYQELYW